MKHGVVLNETIVLQYFYIGQDLLDSFLDYSDVIVLYDKVQYDCYLEIVWRRRKLEGQQSATTINLSCKCHGLQKVTNEVKIQIRLYPKEIKCPRLGKDHCMTV